MRFKLLLEHFKSAENAWKAPLKELAGISIPAAVVSRFADFRNKFDIEGYLKKLSQKEVSFITLTDPNYPYLLKQISDAPIVLYVKGRTSPLPSPGRRGKKEGEIKQGEVDYWLSNNKIAVVGTRKVSSYGREVTQSLTQDLAASGLTIVSGMALGVDTIAHQAAIECKTKTIAVLGCGVDVIYPPQNRDLYEKISQGNGYIISEMPLGHFASRGTFPARNRIISGLSQGVLMTEGAEDSGALITCSYAAEQGRDVFAVPGEITSPLSAGTLGLLKKGAKLVIEAADILEELGIENKQINKYANKQIRKINLEDASEEERKILEIIENEDLTIDDMIRKLKISAGTLGSLLSIMELKGYIREDGGKYKANFKIKTFKY